MNVDRVKAALWHDSTGDRLTARSNADAIETENATLKAESEISESEALLKTAVKYRSVMGEIKARRNNE